MHEKTLLYGAIGATALAAAFGVYRERSASHPATPEPELISPVTMIDSSAQIADSSSPIALTASDGSGIRLVAMTANAVIDDPLALTELRLAFENPENRVREGTFRITLPQGASLSRFAMKVGNVWQEGEVVEKQAARRAYEDFLHRRQDPALLEQGGGNEFTARVFPIPARGRKELILTYAEVLDSKAPYTLPLKGLPMLGSLDIDVRATAARVASFGIHKQRFAPGEDFIVAAKDLPRGGGLRSEELVVARVVPFAATRPDPITSALVLVDTSASRGLGLADQSKLLQRVLAKLADAHVSVAAFDQEVVPIYDGAASAFGKKELDALADRGALGGSNLERAIAWIATEAAKTKSKRVVLLTDGVATIGETDAQKLRAKVEPLRAAGIERIDAIAVGGIRDDGLLRTVVRGVLDKDGTVLDAKLEVETIARRLSEATSSGVPVKVDGSTWSFPTTLDGVQAGDEVVVFAKMAKSSGPVKINVGAQAISPDVRTIERPIVERAVAQAEIQSLVEAPTKDPETTKRDIVALSTKHRVLSPHTALLVLETDQDYARFNIDRNAKVDILTVQGGRVAVMHALRGQQQLAEAAEKKKAEEAPATLATTTAAAAPADNRPSGHAGAAARAGAASDQQAAALSAQAEAMQEQMLAAFNGGSAVEGAAARAPAGGPAAPPPPAEAAPEPMRDAPRPASPPAAHAAAAAPRARAAANATDDGDLRLGTAGSPIQGGGGQGLAGIGGSAGSGAAGAMRNVQGPRGDVQLGSISTTGGSISGAERVVAGLRPRFRACYNNGLQQDPSMNGRVVIDATVAKNGEVAATRTESNTGLSQSVAQCITGMIKRAQFDAPTGDVHLHIPVTFVQQNDSGSSGPRPFEAPPKPPEAKPYDGPFKIVMEQLSRGDKAAALDAAKSWQSKASGDVMALVGLGEAYEAKGDPHSAARAYGSILELFASRADSRRFAGERLERLRDPFALELAADTFAKAAEQRPDHPASHRLYAFTLLKAGQYEKAFNAIVAGSKRSYPPGRFAGVDRILKEDVGLIAAAWAKAEPKRAEEIAKMRSEAGGADELNPSLRFVLVWETDANDVDFHIYDAKGGHAYYANRQLPSGGELYADVTTGYGPECFTIRGARESRAYPYTLQAHYYSRGPMGYGMGKLQILDHDGKGGIAFEERPFVVMVDRAFVDLGTVEKQKK
jgi:hypothetical protein